MFVGDNHIMIAIHVSDKPSNYYFIYYNYGHNTAYIHEAVNNNKKIYIINEYQVEEHERVSTYLILGVDITSAFQQRRDDLYMTLRCCSVQGRVTTL